MKDIKKQLDSLIKAHIHKDVKHFVVFREFGSLDIKVPASLIADGGYFDYYYELLVTPMGQLILVITEDDESSYTILDPHTLVETLPQEGKTDNEKALTEMLKAKGITYYREEV